PAVLYNLAFALEQLGRLPEAETAYADAVSKSRDDARLMLGWAVVALKRNDSEVATNRLARARELWGERPIPPTWYWASALALAGQADLTEAVKIAKEGVAAFPSDAVLRNNLAVLLEMSGDLPGAEMLLRGALSEDPTLPQISKSLGDLFYRAGRYDDASEAYERAAKLSPELGDDLYFKLGNIAFKRRDRERARVCWQRVTELNPAHQLARANLDTLETSACPQSRMPPSPLLRSASRGGPDSMSEPTRIVASGAGSPFACAPAASTPPRTISVSSTGVPRRSTGSSIPSPSMSPSFTAIRRPGPGSSATCCRRWSPPGGDGYGSGAQAARQARNPIPSQWCSLRPAPRPVARTGSTMSGSMLPISTGSPSTGRARPGTTSASSARRRLLW